MKKIILLFVSLCYFGNMYTQEIAVMDIREEANDSIAMINPVYDINNNLCSILKVFTDSIKNIQFSGMIIGEPTEKDGTYILYIPAKTKRIKYLHNDYLSGEIDFQKFNISVGGGKAYYAILKGRILEEEMPQSSVVSSPKYRNKMQSMKSQGSLQYLIFNSKIPIKKIIVNGTEWLSTKKMVQTGRYSYVIELNNGEKRNGEVNITQAGINKIVKIE